MEFYPKEKLFSNVHLFFTLFVFYFRIGYVIRKISNCIVTPLNGYSLFFSVILKEKYTYGNTQHKFFKIQQSKSKDANLNKSLLRSLCCKECMMAHLYKITSMTCNILLKGELHFLHSCMHFMEET